MTEEKDEFVDYFNSKMHEQILGGAFADTYQNAAAIASQEVGDNVDIPPGLFRAISKVQGLAAGGAHFYRTAGLIKQGSAYFRSLADQIEAPDIAPEQGEKP